MKHIIGCLIAFTLLCSFVHLNDELVNDTKWQLIDDNVTEVSVSVYFKPDKTFWHYYSKNNIRVDSFYVADWKLIGSHSICLYVDTNYNIYDIKNIDKESMEIINIRNNDLIKYRKTQ